MTAMDVAGKRVLVRADLDVPVKDKQVYNDQLIRLLLPTIEYLIANEARVIIMGHLGNPKGKTVPALSMEPVAARLAELVPAGEVLLTDSCIGDGAKRVVLDLRNSEIAVLENLSFHSGESSNDERFARELAALGEIYINESVKTLNQNIASVVSVPRYTAKRACGMLLEKELTALTHMAGKVEKPMVAVIGGGDFSKKLPLIQHYLDKADTILVAGVPANTFLASQGYSLGKSKVEENRFPLARDLISRAKNIGVKLVFPIDFSVGADDAASSESIVNLNDVPSDAHVFDIGPKTKNLFKDIVSKAATVLWNGPMGLFERETFSSGTLSMARFVAGSAAFSVVVGKASSEAVYKFGLEKGFNHVSSGGDASLDLLEGKVPSGIGALEYTAK